ncbi:MAG: CaiB/BaiF CoA transferase family protein [Alphaproteobacteria bacterium]
MTLYPYDGLKVLDLSRILAGPWIGQTLADMGADVVKIEAPAGDDTRHWGPPFIEREDGQTAAYYFCCNRGKRSVVANLKDPDQLSKVQALAQQADVIIQNYKVGGLNKFELDYTSVAKGNPRVVYASITGFGQDGPRAEQPGYDLLIQGMSGIMDITGPEDREPQKMGVAFADLFTGIYGVIGIQAALKMRDETGRGQEIDLALFDTLSAVLANQGLNYMVTGRSPKRKGNRHPNLVPYETYQCSDGHIVIATGNDRQFAALCAVLGIPEVATAPEYLTNADRVAHLDDMAEVLNTATARFSRASLIEQLKAAGVPAGPINSIEEAHADPQFAHRGLRIDPEGVPGLRTPLKFSEASLKVERSAPKLGDTDFDDIEW